jgi:tetratricopeptide (TPR) repeat protein
MKSTRLTWVLGAAVLAGLAYAAPASLAQEYLDSPGPAEMTDDTLAEVPPGLEELAQAPNPSAAVEAYSRARLAMPDDVAVDQVYVRRMVELGAPEMCASQANRIVRRIPDDGLAWAVLGVNAAQANDFAAALTLIARAARYEPNHPFVQQTAGQLMAWYDTQADPSQLPSTANDAAREIRHALGGQRDYADAYRQARGMYRQGEQSPPPAPAPLAPVPAPGVTTYEPGYTQFGYGYDYYGYPTWPRYGLGYYSYSSGYCYPWAGTSVFITSGGHDRWRHHDRYINDRTRFPRRHRPAPAVTIDTTHRIQPWSGGRTDRHPDLGSADVPRTGRHTGLTPRTTNDPPRRTGSIAPSRHPLWADTPGVKPRSSSPGLKAPAGPRPSITPRPAASPQPLRVTRTPAPPPARPAASPGFRPNAGPRGK